MFHNRLWNSARSGPAVSVPSTQPSISMETSSSNRLVLLPPGGGRPQAQTPSPWFDLISVSAHRCSAFLAEAAVLVLVLAVLDRFMLKGRMELSWLLGALGISLALLAASIATEFTARRWLKAH